MAYPWRQTGSWALAKVTEPGRALQVVQQSSAQRGWAVLGNEVVPRLALLVATVAERAVQVVQQALAQRRWAVCWNEVVPHQALFAAEAAGLTVVAMGR